MNDELLKTADFLNLLFYHAGAVGDVITTFPLLKVWRENRPNDRIVFLGKPAIGRFAVDCGYADAFWNIDRAVFSHLYDNEPAPALCRRLSGIKAAVVMARDRFGLTQKLYGCGLEFILQQPPFPEKRRHVVAYHLQLVKGLFPTPTAAEPEIPLHRPRRERSVKRVAFHHGSGSRLKNWPKSNYAALSKILKREGYRVSWVRGPADDAPPADADDTLLATDDLSECMTLFNESRLYVGNDSGITHLAAASGCPTVALFGASDPMVWRPLGDHVTVIASKAPCAPCHGYKPIENHCDGACMSAISVDQVYRQCVKRLADPALVQKRPFMTDTNERPY